MSFTYDLIARLERARFEECTHNWDAQRFGPERWTRRLNSWARRAAKALGIGPYRWVHRVRPDALDRWKEVLPQLEWLAARLEDEASRRWLVDLIAYRWLGPRAVKLPLNTPDYWTRLNEIARLQQRGHSIDWDFEGWRLERFDLAALGYPLRLNTRVANVLTQFDLQQYACPRIGVRAEPGDIVIDAGGCFGDTALYFAHQVGAGGRVVSLEFVESNLQLHRHNLSLNPELAQRIEVCQQPVWSCSDLPLYVVDRGPASSVSANPPEGMSAQQVATISIDDLVERYRLPRVDFIKMDIEGAEYEALRGAEKTLRRDRPKLAVCVYHAPQDFVRLARLIDSWVPEYRLALGHYTIHAEETVLFAIPAENRTAGAHHV